MAPNQSKNDTNKSKHNKNNKVNDNNTGINTGDDNANKNKPKTSGSKNKKKNRGHGQFGNTENWTNDNVWQWMFDQQATFWESSWWQNGSFDHAMNVFWMTWPQPPMGSAIWGFEEPAFSEAEWCAQPTVSTAQFTEIPEDTPDEVVSSEEMEVVSEVRSPCRAHQPTMFPMKVTSASSIEVIPSCHSPQSDTPTPRDSSPKLVKVASFFGSDSDSSTVLSFGDSPRHVKVYTSQTDSEAGSSPAASPLGNPISTHPNSQACRGPPPGTFYPPGLVSELMPAPAPVQMPTPGPMLLGFEKLSMSPKTAKMWDS